MTPAESWINTGSAGPNPFVEMAQGWRAAIILYVIVWEWLPSVVSQAIYGSDDEHAVAYALVSLLADLLMLVPLFFRTFGGIPTGWLHPLIFPSLFRISTSLMKDPYLIVHPLLVWVGPIHPPMEHVLLQGWAPGLISLARIDGEWLIGLSLAATYFGYLLWTPRRSRWKVTEPPQLVMNIVGVAAAAALGFMLYIGLRGGIQAHMATFATGRHIALGGEGYILWLVRPAPLILLLWYACRPRAIRNPLFLGLLGFFLAMQFIATGSRTGTLLPLVGFLAVWMLHGRRVPVVQTVGLGLAALIAIGVLGGIRQGIFLADRGVAEIAPKSDLTDTVQAALEDIEERANASLFLPTMAKVPADVDFLYGASYVSALLFFVPRAIWQDKPRSVGAYAMAIIGDRGFGIEGPYEDAGAPPGAVAESYWNFGIPGVLVVFLIFGGFLKWLAVQMTANADVPLFVVFYTATITVLLSPSSDELIPYFQSLVFLLLVCWAAGLRRAPKSR